MKKPPKIDISRSWPLLDIYRKGNEYFSVAKLVEETKYLDVFEVPIASLDLTDQPWTMSSLTDFAFHMNAVNKADLRYPIILDWEGAIADGRHRIIKAILLGKRTIKAKRMHWKPTPCRVEN